MTSEIVPYEPFVKARHTTMRSTKINTVDVGVHQQGSSAKTIKSGASSSRHDIRDRGAGERDPLTANLKSGPSRRDICIWINPHRYCTLYFADLPSVAT
jgi:hypothetical protein